MPLLDKAAGLCLKGALRLIPQVLLNFTLRATTLVWRYGQIMSRYSRSPRSNGDHTITKLSTLKHIRTGLPPEITPKSKLSTLKVKFLLEQRSQSDKTQQVSPLDQP
ncbi:hypothetical protein IFM89_006124 [Coptis chinensis]|uniref:Uncharacterized protein n=1 Tax=Coptis chinensis TaxID=261450 RepID=A0A835GUM2_9MAGN|nr:hypothetical protein IFM89_006124 [Coptis chinensis]